MPALSTTLATYHIPLNGLASFLRVTLSSTVLVGLFQMNLHQGSCKKRRPEGGPSQSQKYQVVSERNRRALAVFDFDLALALRLLKTVAPPWNTLSSLCESNTLLGVLFFSCLDAFLLLYETDCADLD
jgi:hypothetical protein